MSTNTHIAVIGAGIVGLSTALWLQRSGHTVSIIDPKQPGTATSFGNAGVFADFARLPFSNMNTLRSIPKMLLDADSPLSIQNRYIPSMIPYGVGFVKACSTKNYQHGRNALTQLLSLAPKADQSLLSLTDATNLVRSNGSIALIGSSQGFEKAKAGAMRERRQQQVDLQFLNKNEVRELEPDLAPFYAGGVYYPNSRHTINPGGLCQRYANYFQNNGGTIIQQAIKHINPDSSIITLHMPEQILAVDQLVIAAGTASRYLLKPLGINLPLVSERGYHLQLETTEQQLSRPVSWLDKSIFLSPIDRSLRIAGTAEFAYENSPTNEKRMRQLLGYATTMLGFEPTIKSTWVGSRPSLPDSLPIIGPLKGFPNITLAFGHSHVGLTLSSITGHLVAQHINGEKTSVNLDPFSASRFY